MMTLKMVFICVCLALVVSVSPPTQCPRNRNGNHGDNGQCQQSGKYVNVILLSFCFDLPNTGVRKRRVVRPLIIGVRDHVKRRIIRINAFAHMKVYMDSNWRNAAQKSLRTVRRQVVHPRATEATDFVVTHRICRRSSCIVALHDHNICVGWGTADMRKACGQVRRSSVVLHYNHGLVQLNTTFPHRLVGQGARYLRRRIYVRMREAFGLAFDDGQRTWRRLPFDVKVGRRNGVEPLHKRSVFCWGVPFEMIDCDSSAFIPLGRQADDIHGSWKRQRHRLTCNNTINTAVREHALRARTTRCAHGCTCNCTCGCVCGADGAEVHLPRRG
jgi:hypothetical protein